MLLASATGTGRESRCGPGPSPPPPLFCARFLRYLNRYTGERDGTMMFSKGPHVYVSACLVLCTSLIHSSYFTDAEVNSRSQLDDHHSGMLVIQVASCCTLVDRADSLAVKHAVYYPFVISFCERLIALAWLYRSCTYTLTIQMCKVDSLPYFQRSLTVRYPRRCRSPG